MPRAVTHTVSARADRGRRWGDRAFVKIEAADTGTQAVALMLGGAQGQLTRNAAMAPANGSGVKTAWPSMAAAWAHSLSSSTPDAWMTDDRGLASAYDAEGIRIGAREKRRRIALESSSHRHRERLPMIQEADGGGGERQGSRRPRSRRLEGAGVGSAGRMRPESARARYLEYRRQASNDQRCRRRAGPSAARCSRSS